MSSEHPNAAGDVPAQRPWNERIFQVPSHPSHSVAPGSHRQRVLEERLGRLLEQLGELVLAQVVVDGPLHRVLVVDVDDAFQGQLQVSFHPAGKGRRAQH